MPGPGSVCNNWGWGQDNVNKFAGPEEKADPSLIRDRDPGQALGRVRAKGTVGVQSRQNQLGHSWATVWATFMHMLQFFYNVITGVQNNTLEGVWFYGKNHMELGVGGHEQNHQPSPSLYASFFG